MKKKQKIPIIIIAMLVSLSLVIGIWCMTHLNTDGNDYYNISEVFLVEVLGTEGYGYVNVKFNPEFMDKSKINVSDLSYKVSKNNMLSNGDVIIISIEETAGLRFNDMKLEYEIAGLEKGTDLDIFKDIIIEYDSTTGKIILDNSKCSQFIKENVLFSIKYELDEYKVGDVVEIVGYVDMNAATENRYNIITKSYEYTVK